MGAAISPDHKFMAVSNDSQGTQSLQVVNLASPKVVQTIPYYSPNALYLGIAFSPDGKTMYVANSDNNDIAVINLEDGNKNATPSVSGLIPTSCYPTGVFTTQNVAA